MSVAEGNGRWARRWDRFRPFLVPAMIVVAVAGWGTVDLVRDVERRNHAHPPAGPACVSAQVPPEGPGVWWGVNLDFDRKTLAQYASDLGHRPAVTVTFTDLPYTEAQRADLVRAVEQVRADGQILLLTLEPFGGLETVTEQVARQVAADLAEFNAAGVPVIVRLAHEMNGSWYPWGHQPAAYVEMFRTVAAAVHERAPGSAMMWAPNYGGGYPFGGGQFEAAPGSAARAALDTDGDGALTSSDDPYAPYYPGDDAVDWVGMSLYHWGAAYPWGENELPEPGKFAAQLTGSYDGAGGDDTVVPDFYTRYGVEHGKPVAIVETGALYNTAAGTGGPAEFDLKQAWWQQVFDPDLPQQFPQLKMINWFEWDKYEPEVDARVDWTVTNNPQLRRAFTAALPDWLRYGPDRPCTPAPPES